MSFHPCSEDGWTEDIDKFQVCPTCGSTECSYDGRTVELGCSEEYFDCAYTCKKCGCIFHDVYQIEEYPLGQYIECHGDKEEE